jgi:hypothetical protein
LAQLDDEHPLRLIAGKIKGLTLFEFCEEIVNRPIFEKAGNGDLGKGMDIANQFVLDLIGAIPRFHAGATIAAFHAFGLVTKREKMELREHYCAEPGKVFVPLSISSAYVQRRQKSSSARRRPGKR